MCSRQLVPGEEFALLPEGLICGTHIKQQQHPTPVSHDPLPGMPLTLGHSYPVPTYNTPSFGKILKMKHSPESEYRF